MKKITALLSLALFASVSTASLSFADDCGCYTPPPVTKKVKVNSGVGNGAEFGPDESADRDPGNSQANNSAGKNSDKPNSPRAGTSIP